MILDPEPYRVAQIPYIKSHIIKHKVNDTNIIEHAGTIADARNLHIVLATFFVGEIAGFTPGVIAKIKRDMAYYRIDNVIGFEKYLTD